jgi:hypothetical protein
MLTQFFGNIKPDGSSDTTYTNSGNFTSSWNASTGQYEIKLDRYIAARPLVFVDLEENAGWGTAYYQTQGTSLDTETNQYTVYVSIKESGGTAVQWRFAFSIKVGSIIRKDVGAENSLDVIPEIISFGTNATPVLKLSAEIPGTLLPIGLDTGTLLPITTDPANSSFTLQLSTTSITHGSDTYSVAGYTYSGGNNEPTLWTDGAYPITLPEQAGLFSPFQRFVILATNDTTGAVLRSDPLIDVEKKGS